MKSLRSNESPLQVLAPVVLHLMNHSLELGLKYTLWELHQITKQDYDFKKYKNHNLTALLALLKNRFYDAAKQLEVGDGVVESFEEYCAKTQNGIVEFDRLDFTKSCFRYPFDNSGKAYQTGEIIDLSLLLNTYGEAMILLRHTADVLGEYVAFLDWKTSVHDLY